MKKFKKNFISYFIQNKMKLEFEDLFSYLENIFDKDILGKIFIILEYSNDNFLSE